MKTFLFLVLIIIFAAFLRFYQLGQNPPSLTWDEAAWGYNAYSLGIDGRDEFGRFLPIDYLESFGDFKPPVYAYLAIMPVKIFGLNELAVRFPSAALGVLTVLVTYFLVRELFANRNAEIIALISSFLLAVSPWHINLSRAAFEANVATFFIVSGVWLFLRGVSRNKWLLVFSAISFVLSVYTFNTARIVSPLLTFILGLAFRRQLWEAKKQSIIAALFAFLLILPTLNFLLSPQAGLRFKEVNIFSDGSVVKISNQEIANDQNAWWSKILHNRRFLFAQEYLRHYFDNLNPSFLFIKGDGNPKFSTQDVGELYFWEIPFLIGGLLFIFKKREKNFWLVPLWLIIGIVPAATARETPHALRIETTLPTFQILTAIGIVSVFSIVSNLRNLSYLRHLIFIFTFLFFTFNFLYYFHGYYAHYPREFSREWQYGYKDAILYIKNAEANYDKIYFTDNLGRPYIYLLFYTQYDPREFRKTAVVEREAFGFVHVKSFNRYVFPEKSMDIKTQTKEKILYVDVPDRVPGNANIKDTFYLLNGNSVLVAYTL